eukprot:TCALIF_07425-PA protein Name:"Similar to FTZ-F1 Nuclear hormone receptor FTZ-F1 (Bombyx mori)" AED:0.27 eAED:0.27 QI:0/0/0/0.2/1/1/5/0/551
MIVHSNVHGDRGANLEVESGVNVYTESASSFHGIHGPAKVTGFMMNNPLSNVETRVFDIDQYSDETLEVLLSSSLNQGQTDGFHREGTLESNHPMDEGVFDFPDLFTTQLPEPQDFEVDLKELESFINEEDWTLNVSSTNGFPTYQHGSESSFSPQSTTYSHNRKFSRSSDEGISLSPESTNFSSSLGSPEDPDNLPTEAILQVNAVPEKSTDPTESEDNFPQSSMPPSDWDPEKCYICQEKAGKHNYYGGKACPSCRAFFRRAVQSKYYEIFFCNKGEKCEINLKTRRSCQFCRFKKCLDSGMRVAWVLPDGERNRRFNKLRKSVQKNKTQMEAEKKAAAEKSKMPLQVRGVLPGEIDMIRGVHLKVDNLGAKSLREFILTQPDFMKKLANFSYFGGQPDMAFIQRFQLMCDKFAHFVMTTSDEFKMLSFGDRRQLVEVNGPLLNRFKCSVTIQETNSCLVNGIEQATKSGEFPYLNDIAHKLEMLNMSDRKPILAYNQFYASPWASSKEAEGHLETGASTSKTSSMFPLFIVINWVSQPSSSENPMASI